MREVTIQIPVWLFKVIAAIMGFWVLLWSLAFLLAGYPLLALVACCVGIGLIPVHLVVTYMYWRFFWWLTAAWMFFGSACSMPLVLPVVLSGQWRSQLPVNPAVFPVVPVENILLFIAAAAVIAAIVFVTWRARRSPGKTSGSPAPVNPGTLPGSLSFDVPDFHQRVSALIMQQSGLQTAIENDYIRVYKARNLAGVVKCIDKPGKPVSPLMVKDAAKLAERLGVTTVYLATSGYFPTDAKQEAARLGVKPIEMT